MEELCSLFSIKAKNLTLVRAAATRVLLLCTNNDPQPLETPKQNLGVQKIKTFDVIQKIKRARYSISSRVSSASRSFNKLSSHARLHVPNQHNAFDTLNNPPCCQQVNLSSYARLLSSHNMHTHKKKKRKEKKESLNAVTR